MASVLIEPAQFRLVSFDRDRLQVVADRVAADTGFGGEPVHLEVDETTPQSRSRVDSVEPVRLRVESGAMEDRKRPRHLSDVEAAEVLGRLLLEVADRRNPEFGAPDDGEELSLALRTAWDIYALARLARMGYGSQEQRWRYHFRNRCGFSDTADAAFDTLWETESLTWPQIEALVEGSSGS